MHKRSADNLKTILLLLLIITATRLTGGIPWWSFVIPVLLLGIIITLKGWKVASFLIGFSAGFIVWLGAGLYFHAVYNGNILDRFAPHSGIIILLIAALMGGLLTGLALYTGKAIVHRKD